MFGIEFPRGLILYSTVLAGAEENKVHKKQRRRSEVESPP